MFTYKKHYTSATNYSLLEIMENGGQRVITDQNVDYVNFVANGGTPEIVEYVEPTDEQKWELIRRTRNRLLLETDWAVLEDIPFTDEEKIEIKAYRQDLRDIPQDFNDPDEVDYPTKPNCL